MTASPDPDLLDQQAAVLYDTVAWQAVVDGWHTPAPGPAPENTVGVPDRHPAAAPPADLVGAVPGLLLTRTTEQLIADAGIHPGPAPASTRPRVPGRIAALVPDRLHTWRRLYQFDLKPSVQLAYAAAVLETWGWQNQPYRLRDARGARCVCGAILACQRLGLGSRTTAERSAAFVLAELRARGWHDLIGPWNRAPGRTADQAIALIEAAAHRAVHTGH
ncbi:DUF6197 family protein [Streptomyces sp.]|uniref:DUF6197 family protein n=1 Tax=Streptomyces sp. TaxID=1931 RepID=UPI002F3F0393